MGVQTDFVTTLPSPAEAKSQQTGDVSSPTGAGATPSPKKTSKSDAARKEELKNMLPPMPIMNSFATTEQITKETLRQLAADMWCMLRSVETVVELVGEGVVCLSGGGGGGCVVMS